VRPATKTQETFIGKSWLAKQLKIHPYKVHYYAIKLRLRYFKFSGVRYIEKDDALCLIDRLQLQFHLPDTLVNDVKNQLS